MGSNRGVSPHSGAQSGEHAGLSSSRLLNEKVALDAHMKYDGDSSSNGPTWRSRARNYIITKAPDAETILDLVESHKDVPVVWLHISITTLEALGLFIDGEIGPRLHALLATLTQPRVERLNFSQLTCVLYIGGITHMKE